MANLSKLIYMLGVLIFAIAIGLHAHVQSQISAESAFLKSLAESSPLTQIEFQGMHDAPAPIGNILFFSWKDARSATVQYGYVPVKRNIFGNWRVGKLGTCSQNGEKQTGSRIAEFHAHYLWLPYDYNSMSDVSVVCGHTNKSDVQNIVVIWKDGTITRDEVKESRFVVFAPQRQSACELQLLDAWNVLIQTIDLSKMDFVSWGSFTPLPSCNVPSNG